MKQREEEDDGVSSPKDRYSNVDLPASGAIVDSPEQVGMNAYDIQPLPAAEDMLCAQGPCRHYWRLVTLGPDGKENSPRQIHHTCLVQPGRETELTDDFVYECSRWDPMDDEELAQIIKRRSQKRKQP